MLDRYDILEYYVYEVIETRANIGNLDMLQDLNGSWVESLYQVKRHLTN